jgi:hypothetical protein
MDVGKASVHRLRGLNRCLQRSHSGRVCKSIQQCRIEIQVTYLRASLPLMSSWVMRLASGEGVRVRRQPLTPCSASASSLEVSCQADHCIEEPCHIYACTSSPIHGTDIH